MGEGDDGTELAQIDAEFFWLKAAAVIGGYCYLNPGKCN